MEYAHVCEAIFLERPNRFLARVLLNGREETVHVKNTGRCRELLVPGRRVILAEGENPARKTKFDLICAEKPGLGLVNLDSQAPNRVMQEWLLRQDYSLVRPEWPFGSSRLDFYLERGPEKTLVEVKGCTLEVDGVGYFPDAPTQRGARHLRELMRAAELGYRAAAAFVIQMPGITQVLPNEATDPAFSQALRQAQAAGVEVWQLPCRITEHSLEIL